MTETAWLSCQEPMVLLGQVRGSITPRQLRLFAVACYRRIDRLVDNARNLECVALAEHYADDRATEDALAEARDAVLARRQQMARAWSGYFSKMDQAVAAIAWHTAVPDAHFAAMRCATLTADLIRNGDLAPERAAQADLVRELVGNPFRPVVVLSSWRTPAVLALARAIYDEKAFEQLPILGDALEDADCTYPTLLDHCRQPGRHVRGCWLLDAVLGQR